MWSCTEISDQGAGNAEILQPDFDANTFCVIGQVIPGEVKLKENLVHHSLLYF